MRTKKTKTDTKKKLKYSEIVKITKYLDDIKPPLTKKQRLFCYYYVITCEYNQTQAAFLAGYKSRSDPENDMNIARVSGYDNLQKPAVKEAVARISKNCIKNHSQIEKTLFDMLWKRANYDVNIFKNSDGTFKPLDDIPRDWRCVIDHSEIKYYGRNAEVEVLIHKLADRDKAIDKLDKYIKWSQGASDNQSDNIPQKEQINIYNILYGKTRKPKNNTN